MILESDEGMKKDKRVKVMVISMMREGGYLSSEAFCR